MSRQIARRVSYRNRFRNDADFISSVDLMAALFLALFGAGLIYGIGSAAPMRCTTPPHDVRHSNGFPCH